MTAEQITRNYLISAGLSVGSNVFLKVPVKPPTEYVLIEKIGGNRTDRIDLARLNIQSRSDSDLETAMNLNEEVKDAMEAFADASDDISGCHLSYDENFTNPASKQYRYQAGFNIYF